MSGKTAAAAPVAAYSCVLATLRHLAFCLRLLADGASDLCFRVLLGNRSRRILPPLSDSILMSSSATALAGKIRRKEITSEQLVLACIARISEIQPLINAVVDERFDMALEEARKVDRLIASQDSETLLDDIARDTPFLGVPFSTKEGIKVQGLHQSYGVIARKSFISPSDSDVVRSLKTAGAILLCVTNVSELGMWWDSSNHVYGTTCNPYDTRRSPGGSSGGEAALQCSAGIPLSIGSDSGGSIRTPAFFCGLFGHKPTPGLISIRGANTVDPPPGYVSELQVIGPLCRFAEDLVPIYKVLLGQEKFEKLRLDEEIYLTRLRYFYLDCSIGSSIVSPVSPEINQALFRTVDFLEDTYGVTVHAVKFTGMQKAVSMFMASLAKNEYGPSFAECLTDNKGSASLLRQWLLFLAGRSDYTLPSLVNLALERAGEICRFVGSIFFPRRKRQAQIHTDIDNLRNEVSNVLGDDGVLICPPHPSIAPYHFQSYTKPFNFLYTGIFNVLQLPVSSIPLGLNQDGLPLGIQVAAAHSNDRLCLAVARALERPFGGWTPPFRQKQDELFF